MHRRKMVKAMLGILLIMTLVKGITPGAGADDSWRRVADLPIPRSHHAATVVDGRIYVLGGHGNGEINVVIVYDPVTDQWRRVADMRTHRWNLAAAVVDGKIYAIGGTGGGFCTGYSTVEMYDPTTDSWCSRAPMPTPRCDLAAVAVGGKIYAIGGQNQGDCFATVEEYDPETDTWRSRAPMPTARFGLAAEAATLNGKIYAIGGRNDAYRRRLQYLHTVEEYDPVTDSWHSRAPMPTPRVYLAAVAEGSRIYVLGGQNFDCNNLATVEEYDPATDIWKSRTPMPTARGGLAAVAVGGRIYAIGGDHKQVVEEYVPFNYEVVPTVTVVSPNGGEYWSEMQTITWTATDPQGDPLTYTVYYSPNGGQTWTQLAAGLTEPSYLWDTTTVVDGANYRIKVEANDGTYTMLDISNAPFEITNALLYTTEWRRTYGGSGEEIAYTVIQTMDSGFVLVGYTTSSGAGGSDAWLVKTDAHGTREWQQTYGGTEDDVALAAIPTVDGGYALAGYTNSSGAGYKDFWLVKTDAHGTREWAQTYGSAADVDVANAVIQTTDGGFALAGYTWTYGGGNYDGLLVKTNARGVMQWNQRYGDANAESNKIDSVFETPDGGFVLTICSSYSWGGGQPGARLVKTDVNGKEEWCRDFTSLIWSFYSGIQTVDGGFAFGGYKGLVKTDANGNMEWYQNYGVRAYSVIQTTDGGFAYTCGTGDFLLAKTDTYGAMEWDLTIGGPHDDTARSVIEMADGGFVLAGSTKSFGGGGADFWLVKTIPPETRPPELSAPEDIAYEEGTRGQVINWTVGDRNPEIYVLYNNTEQMDSGLWMNGTITWNVDGLAPGSYNITLVTRDLFNNRASDTVWVIVFAASVPDLSKPEDIVYEEGATGHIITWVVGDRHPGTYAIYTNSEQVDSGLWMNGTITWNVDGFALGTYNITLVACDLFNNNASDTVWVTVMAPTTPTTPFIPGFSSVELLLALACLVVLARRRTKR